MVGLPKIAVTVVILDVDDVVIEFLFQAQAKLVDAFGNHCRATDQCGARNALVHHDLRRTQNALFFTFAVGDAFFEGPLGGGDDGLHHGARGVNKALQALAVSVHVGDRARRHAAVGSSLCHRWRDLDHQARIEGLGNQVFGAKGQGLAHIGGRYHFALLGLGQFGDGVDGGDFHLQGDGGCA